MHFPEFIKFSLRYVSVI